MDKNTPLLVSGASLQRCGRKISNRLPRSLDHLCGVKLKGSTYAKYGIQGWSTNSAFDVAYHLLRKASPVGNGEHCKALVFTFFTKNSDHCTANGLNVI